MKIEGCPSRIAGSQMNSLLRHAGYAEKGFLPLSGGTLDQTQWFLEACEMVWADQAQHRKHQLEQLK